MMLRRWLLVLALVAVPTRAFAVQPDEVLQDPGLETRARSISEGLRCLVCQNQSIDDSGAPLARDLRLLVRERLKAGDTDAEVRGFLVSRYGDFVLLKPPFETRTVLLWGLPFILLVAGGAALFWRRRASGTEPPLSPDEEARLATILGEPPRS